MSLLTRLVSGSFAILVALTVLHGGLNHRWFESKGRERLVIAHLPVT